MNEAYEYEYIDKRHFSKKEEKCLLGIKCSCRQQVSYISEYANEVASSRFYVLQNIQEKLKSIWQQ